MTPPDRPRNHLTFQEMRLTPGTIMFGATLMAVGSVRPTPLFEFERVDPVLDRRLGHRYRTISLAAS
jgi:hypothetical protein